MGCRLSRSQDWATRIHHEAQLHERSSFVTLTFRDADLPADYSVSVRDVQLFMKRLRKSVHAVRYFACGEYGDRNGRPHYHLIIFGHDFPDRVPWRRTGSGFVIDRSASLERLWPHGHCEVGTVTHQSAAYVARYCTKKVTGDLAAEHYTRVHPMTGQVVQVKPEFIVMSSRPGIGAAWFDEFAGDAFPSDFVVVDGRRSPVPKYYAKKLAEREALKVKTKRKENARLHADNNTDTRLLTRDESSRLKAAHFTRELDDET